MARRLTGVPNTMHIQHNYLRTYRKRSGLKQSDIKSLLDLPNRSSIGIWERGKRKTSLDLLILYHILFDKPIEHFFERQKDMLQKSLIERIQTRIQELMTLPYSQQISGRIGFLSEVLNKISDKSV